MWKIIKGLIAAILCRCPKCWQPLACQRHWFGNIEGYMKMYTNSEQTAKLIELGFEKPKFEIETQLCNIKGQPLRAATIIGDYSIGELIEMLPQTINVFYDLSIMSSHKGWQVLYGMIGDGDMWSIEHEVYRNELIDALYAMILQLKEEGVI